MENEMPEEPTALKYDDGAPDHDDGAAEHDDGAAEPDNGAPGSNGDGASLPRPSVSSDLSEAVWRGIYAIRILVVMVACGVDLAAGFGKGSSAVTRSQHGFVLLCINAFMTAVWTVITVWRRKSDGMKKKLCSEIMIVGDIFFVGLATAIFALSTRATITTYPSTALSRTSLGANTAWLVIDLVFTLVSIFTIRQSLRKDDELHDRVSDIGDSIYIEYPRTPQDSLFEFLKSFAWFCLATAIFVGYVVYIIIYTIWIIPVWIVVHLAKYLQKLGKKCGDGIEWIKQRQFMIAGWRKVQVWGQPQARQPHSAEHTV